MRLLLLSLMVLLSVVRSKAGDYDYDDYYDSHEHHDSPEHHDDDYHDSHEHHDSTEHHNDDYHDSHEHHDDDYHDSHEHHDDDYHDDDHHDDDHHDDHHDDDYYDDHDPNEDHGGYDHSHEDYDYDHHQDFKSSKKMRYPPEGPPHPKACADKLPNCASLKSDCRWYGDRCKKTCGLCKAHQDDDHHDDDYHDDYDYDHSDEHHEDSCVDVYNDCGVIARKGWCAIYPGKCCQSCGDKKKRKDVCKDDQSGCARYKRYKCKKFPDKCKKTCGLC